MSANQLIEVRLEIFQSLIETSQSVTTFLQSHVVRFLLFLVESPNICKNLDQLGEGPIRDFNQFSGDFEWH